MAGGTKFDHTARFRKRSQKKELVKDIRNISWVNVIKSQYWQYKEQRKKSYLKCH